MQPWSNVSVLFLPLVGIYFCGMQIVKRPAAFNFAGNISDIVVQTNVPMDFKLFVLNGGQLLDERYIPINGEVTIRVRDLLEKVAPAAKLEAGFIELPLYTWAVGDLPAEQFRCMRGGHQATTDSATFAKSNFLTWQPQTRRVNYHTPLRLSYVVLGSCDVMVRGHFKDGTTQEATIRSLLPNTLHTLDVSYGTVAGLFGGEYPSYYDIWVQGAGIKSYTQRYMYGEPSDKADEFMWINSLGGVDTAIFTGDLKRELKYDSITSLFDRTETEFEIDVKRVYTKLTGYLPSKNEQLWVLDFFYSTARYHNDAGALRRIIVSAPKTQSTRGELSGYEFSFAHSTQSPYLNLPRLEVPELLEIEEPGGEVFFLAPRLALFDAAEIGLGDVLIPVQYASSTRWLNLPLADILRLIVSGGGGGALQAHAMSHAQGGSDPIGPYSIGAAKINGDRYKNFAAQDFTARNATVEQEVKADKVYAKTKVISPFVSSPEFLAAMLGYGFGMYMDENGESHLHVDHGHFRGSFETLEMRYRKLLVSGEDVLVSSGGVVEEVLPTDQTFLNTPDGRLVLTQDRRKIWWPSNGRVVFKLKGEPGIDIQQFDVDDILRYTWRDTQTGNSGASGWLRVKQCFDTFWYEGEVVSGSPEWLQKGMTLGQFGNYTKKDRQGFINISARDKHVSIWDEVNNHVLSPSMLKAYLGDLRYVTDVDFPMMTGFGLYAQSCYLKGVFVLKNGKRVDEEFERVETEFLILDGKIASKVSKQEFTSLWTQEADAIVSTVSGEGFKSYILQKADKIELNALNVLVNGLLTVSGLIKADKIDTDKLTARSLDTRNSKGQGVLLTPGSDSISIYGWDSTDPDVKLWFGKTHDNVTLIDPTLELGRNEWDKTVLSKLGGLKIFHGSRVTPSVELSATRLKLPPTATVDMPGVLCAGRVDGGPPYKTQWGALEVSLERIDTGKFRLHHNLKHQGYHTLANPLGLYSNRTMLMVTVVNEMPTYSEIWVTDRSNEELLNGNFNFAIFGNGKQV